MTTAPAAVSSNGAARRLAWPRATSAATHHTTGTAAAAARTVKASIAADSMTIATVVARASGADHCQPMVSCDQMSAPKPRKTAVQQASDTRLALT
jgi:hypothetical protein